ncbi:MAG: hypothetical protein ACRDJX_06970, partial [Solirubrobacteraceae bacterium]
PAFLSQKSKAYDSSAKTLAQTAQTAAETYATESPEGNYAEMSTSKLQAIEPSINTTNPNEAKLTVAEPIESNAGYKVTAEAENTKDNYTIERNKEGKLTHTCKAPAGGTGCPGHKAESSGW